MIQKTQRDAFATVKNKNQLMEYACSELQLY